MTRALVANPTLRHGEAPAVPRWWAASWSLALLGACLVALATRPWGLGWLAWVAFAPAFAAVLSSRTVAQGAAAAAVASLGLASVAYEAAAGIGVWAYPLACLVAAAPFAAAGAAAVALRRRRGVRAATIALPLLWCAAEWLPAQPWFLGEWALALAASGYTQSGLPAMHLARFSSVTATSLAVLSTNALLLRVVQRRSVRAVGGIAAIAVLVVGAWWTRPSDARPTAGVRLRLVQPHLSDAERAAASVLPEARQVVLARLRAASVRPVASQGGTEAVLTIWPEAAWPGLLTHDGGSALLSPEDAGWFDGLGPVLLGAAARSTVDGSVRRANAAFLWTGSALRHVFDKRHLVPLAEAGLAAGAGPVVVDVGGVAVAPAICYDVVFPSFARAAARSGAGLLAVLTDDAFAARSDVPINHLRVAAFRAVETGLPLAFASNTAPAAVLDGAGRVLARTEAGSQDMLVATLGIGAGTTPYVRYGDWVGALVCLTLVGWTALAGARGGASTRPPPA